MHVDRQALDHLERLGRAARPHRRRLVVGARLVPEDVKGMASLISNTTFMSDSAKDAVIDTLISFADTAEKLENLNQ